MFHSFAVGWNQWSAFGSLSSDTIHMEESHSVPNILTTKHMTCCFVYNYLNSQYRTCCNISLYAWANMFGSWADEEIGGLQKRRL